MEAKYVITNYNSKKISFLLEGNSLSKVDFVENDSLIGGIYTAKVVNIVKSINAAFVDIGTGDYLYYPIGDNEDRHIFLRHGKSNKVCVGDEILVQVSMDPIKSKKGVVSSDITLKGDYLILNRSSEIGISKKITDEARRKELSDSISFLKDEEKIGVIIRTAAANVDVELVKKEAAELLENYHEIVKKAESSVCKKLIYNSDKPYINQLKDIILKNKYESFSIVTDIADIYEELSQTIEKRYLYFYDDDMLSLDKLYSFEDKLKKGFNKYIYLKSGGTIVVEPTEAMTVIDVNTGKAIKGKNVQDTFLKINKEAASEIARILRLRNLSGIIIIDFISMTDSNKSGELINHLKSELAKDETMVKYVDITSLGLVELTRKKISKPLQISMF